MPNPTTITIGSNTYPAYADVAFVSAYLAASIHGASWEAAEELTQKQACVSFTRTMDRQVWLGSKTDPEQDTAFPRTGLTYVGGAAVDPDTVPPEFLNAFCEGCLALVDGSSLQTAPSTESNVASLQAGSVAITFWRGAGGEPSRFPLIVEELIGLWLSTAETGIASIYASGLDGCSAFKRDYGFTEGF